jgi:ankyrin repeat protein
VIYRKAEAVRVLLELGADARQARLTSVALFGCAEIAAMLIAGGASVDLADAILLGDASAVAERLRSGASIHGVGRCGKTPLMAAVMAGNTELVRTLLDRGAEPSGGPGSDALGWAASRGQLDIAAELLARGADPNAEGIICTPLMSAARGKHRSLVQLLLSHGADAEHGSANDSPLQQAADQGQVEIVEFLLDAGADPNRGTPYGRSPLRAAARCGSLRCASLLLERGALPDGEEEARYAVTPLGLAQERGMLEMVALLRSYGAKVSHWGRSDSERYQRQAEMLLPPARCLLEYRLLLPADVPVYPAWLEEVLAPALGEGGRDLRDLLAEASASHARVSVRLIGLLDRLRFPAVQG